MPINSNNSKLKVETNVGGVIYEDETARDVFYKRNSQSQEQRQQPALQPHGRANPFGHYDENLQAKEEFEMPPEMEKAIADDLTDKGVAAKPKRTRKKKTTEPND